MENNKYLAIVPVNILIMDNLNAAITMHTMRGPASSVAECRHINRGTNDSWLHVAVPWMPWLKNSIVVYKRLSTDLGLKTLNTLGLGGTTI